MTTSGPVLGKERNSEFFDSLDHVIDIHGHIIGMGLSPDHRLKMTHTFNIFEYKECQRVPVFLDAEL